MAVRENQIGLREGDKMKKRFMTGALCLLTAHVFAGTVADLEALQSANGNLAHQYTFEGTYDAGTSTGTWLDNKAAATPDLSQTLFEAARKADQQTSAYDSSSKFANFDAFSSGAKGDGLTSGASSITFATSGTIEYLVQVGTMTNNGAGRFMVSGDGAGGSNDRFQFLVMYGTGVNEARMSLGANSQRVVFGGSTGVAYNEGDWYYVAQTWDFSSGSSVTMNAWVANLTAGDKSLTKTVNNQVNSFAGNGVAELELGNLSNQANYFADGGLDALAVYDAKLSESTIQNHFDKIQGRGTLGLYMILSFVPKRGAQFHEPFFDRPPCL
jgi:hypothetical protein